MMSYYAKLHELQHALFQEELDDKLQYRAEVQPLADEHAKLNKKLAEKFKEPIQQFQDGLISTIELFDKLYYEAFTRPIEEETTCLN